MRHLAKLRNPIRGYAWGSTTAIPELLGRSPTGAPQAELWIGAHAAAPSEVLTGGRWHALDALIRDQPRSILGRRVADRFGPRLPFLLKVLAAASPLSIQAHPDASQARTGFAADNASGLEPDDPRRNYVDAHHKPELLVALTPFWVMRGFRTPAQIAARLDALGVRALLPGGSSLEGVPDARRLCAFFETYLAAPQEAIEAVLPALLDAASDRAAVDDACRWVGRLAEAYPGDRGLLAPLLLHTYALAPGEAVFTGPGVLHAYLDGLGVELMASSDNVLRGGLTPKHVDVPELLRVLRFDRDGQGDGRFDAEGGGEVLRYAPPAAEFALSMHTLAGDAPLAVRTRGGAELLLVTDGRGTAHADGVDGAMPLTRGDALLVPGTLDGYRLHGALTVYRAHVP